MVHGGRDDSGREAFVVDLMYSPCGESFDSLHPHMMTVGLDVDLPIRLGRREHARE